MPPLFYTSSVAKFLLVVILITLGALATISVSHGDDSPQFQRHSISPEDKLTAPSHEKRLLRSESILNTIPGVLDGSITNSAASSSGSRAATYVDTSLPMLYTYSPQGQDSMPPVISEQFQTSENIEPRPTRIQLGSLADELDEILNSVVPIAAPSIIAEITGQAAVVIASVEAIATDVASLENEITHAALGQMRGLLGSLDSKVDEIINAVSSSLYSGLLLTVSKAVGQVPSSKLGDIAGVANDPLSFVGNIIEQNACSVVTSIDGFPATVAVVCGEVSSTAVPVSSDIAAGLITTSDITLTQNTFTITGFRNPLATPSSSTIIPVSNSSLPAPDDHAASMGLTTTDTNSLGSNPAGSDPNVSPSDQQLPNSTGSQTIPASPGNFSTSGISGGLQPTLMSILSSSSPSNSVVTSEDVATNSSWTVITMATASSVVAATTETQAIIQLCSSSMVGSVTIQTVTSTIYPPCPASPCVSTPQATCDCPSTETIPPEGKGPCPGTGYTCDDCLDGWFCPPSQTPAQPAPCGFGWPCAHCEDGWFCAPMQTSGPCMGSSPSNTGSLSTTVPAQITSSPSTSSGPVLSRPSPPPEKVTGWSYCGCWADDRNQRALSMEISSSEFLTNEACVQHCMVRGFVMAGTEWGNICLCGNFLNRTQKVDEGICSMPCAGDATQICGGPDALSCYSPDGQPYGWANAGPQPRAPTVLPPEVLELNIGGVAQTQVTTPVVIFPPEDANPGDIIRIYGKTTSQPLGDLPRNFTLPPSPSSGPLSPSTPPSDGSGETPGQGTSPAMTLSNSQSTPMTHTPSGSESANTTPSSAPSTPGTPSGLATPPTPGITSPENTPTNPDTLGPPATTSVSVTPSVPSIPIVSSTPGISNAPGSSSSSAHPDGDSGVAPGHGNPPTSSSSSSGGPGPSSPTEITPTGPNTNTISSNPSGSAEATSPSTPNESLTVTSSASSSNPNGNGGVAPGHGPISSTTPGGINPSSVPSNESTVPFGMTSQQLESASITSTGSNSSNQGTTAPPTDAPGSSMPCTPGIGMDCGPTATDSNSDIQLSGSITTSSPPASGGSVAPGQGQPSASSTPGSSPVICAPGSTDTACLSTHSSENMPSSSSPSSSTNLSASVTTCSQGSNDPACTSPVSAGGVAPGHGQPSTPVTGTTSSTSPMSGSVVTPSQNPVTSSVSNTTPLDLSSTTSPMSQTDLSAVPSDSGGCQPGVTGSNCAVPSNGGGPSSTETLNQPTSPISNPVTQVPTTTNVTPSGDGGSQTNGQDLPTPSPVPTEGAPSISSPVSSGPLSTSEGSSMISSTSSLGPTSSSTPNGAGAVAPGQQTPSTQNPESSETISETVGNSSSGTSSGTGSTVPATTSSSPDAGVTPSTITGQMTTSNSSSGIGSLMTSYSYPPGGVPYGARAPSMRTVASMLAWRQPDGEAGAAAMLNTVIMHSDTGQAQESVAMVFEEDVQTTDKASPRSTNPRWQRIRPVYVW